MFKLTAFSIHTCAKLSIFSFLIICFFTKRFNSLILKATQRKKEKKGKKKMKLLDSR